MPARSNRESGELTGRKKAAILLLSLGPDIASDIYRNLSDKEIEQITFEIANLQSVSPERKNEVIEEFYHTAMAKQYISHGGVGTAKEILERAVGSGKAMEILERLQGVLTGQPFDFLKHVDIGQLSTFVQNEHPQTIALILAHLNPEQSAKIMNSLPPETQRDVAVRIAGMDQTNPEIISEVERILEQKLANVLSQELNQAGGVEALAELLNQLETSSSKRILENVEQQNSELASEVKKRMFTFDDLVVLDDRSLQKVLSSIDTRELALALKGANEAVRMQIFGNMSARAAEMLRDDLDSMGPVRIQQVEESQQNILNLLRRMEEEGEIFIERSQDGFIE